MHLVTRPASLIRVIILVARPTSLVRVTILGVGPFWLTGVIILVTRSSSLVRVIILVVRPFWLAIVVMLVIGSAGLLLPVWFFLVRIRITEPVSHYVPALLLPEGRGGLEAVVDRSVQHSFREVLTECRLPAPVLLDLVENAHHNVEGKVFSATATKVKIPVIGDSHMAYPLLLRLCYGVGLVAAPRHVGRDHVGKVGVHLNHVSAGVAGDDDKVLRAVGRNHVPTV